MLSLSIRRLSEVILRPFSEETTEEEPLLKVQNEYLSFFIPNGKYCLLHANLESLLNKIKKEVQVGQLQNINLEMGFKIERSVDESKKTLDITITKDQITEFVSFIKETYNESSIYAQITINNIYKTLLSMQFFIQKSDDNEFIKKQIEELKPYVTKEKCLEPLTKSIRMIVDDIEKRNKKFIEEKSNEEKDIKSNELFIETISYIDRLLNNIENYDDLIKKILNNSTILKNSAEWSNIENYIISMFEKCFDAISISIENNLIDLEIYTNTKYIKVIEKFINIIPEKKQEKFIECLNTIKSAQEKQNEISTNSIIKSKNECYKLYFENKGRIIKIEFCDSKSVQDFKNKFSDLYKKLKIKHNRLNTILSQDTSLLGDKILNITCNGKTYKGKGDVWNIEENYSNINTSTTYSESYNLSPKSEKTDTKQVEQKTSTNSSISKSNVLTYVKNKKKIEIEFKSPDSTKEFKEKFSKIKHDCINTILSQYGSLLKGEISNITCNGKTYKGEGNVWDEKNYFNKNSEQTKDYFSR